MRVTIARYPQEEDWKQCQEDALVTVGKKPVKPWDKQKRHKMLVQRHSPIRDIKIRFLLENIPYCISMELARHHEGFEKYIQSQRNDRQANYDRNEARQDAPVSMRITLNAEAMMELANKRLCRLATKEAQYIVGLMCRELEMVAPEFKGTLVPMCQYHGGKCHEENGCGLCPYDGMEAE